MARKALLLTALAFGLGGAGAGFFATRPAHLPAARLAELADLTPDAGAGEKVFWAAGCASCHAAPDSSETEKTLLSGGQAFVTEFGTFFAPNISPHPAHGIGNWTLAEFATALTLGVSPRGQHYYPAFPYAAYQRMTPRDLVDLKAYLDTLPASATPSRAHDVEFPFSIRRALGVWKLFYLRPDWVLQDPATPQIDRGRYLVEALAHCGECHTPRTALGGLALSYWMAGAPNPTGPGRIPNITPAGLAWSVEEIEYYLETGFTPDFDVVGGHMAPVIGNMAHLSAEDRAAIVAYLKALPALPNPVP